MQNWGNRSFIDGEVIMHAGEAIWNSGYQKVDEAVFDWFRKDSTLIRQEITANFLWGYWGAATTISTLSVCQLIDSLPHLPVDSSVYAATVMALFSLAVSKKTGLKTKKIEEIRTILLKHLDELKRTGLQSSLARSLEYLRSKR